MIGGKGYTMTMQRVTSIIVLLALAVFAVARPSAQVARKSPEFTISQPSGKTILLSSFKGKVVVIEFLFGIPGLGQEFVTSILSRDYNVVIGVFTFYSALVGLANLSVDMLYPILDPRIRY